MSENGDGNQPKDTNKPNEPKVVSRRHFLFGGAGFAAGLAIKNLIGSSPDTDKTIHIRSSLNNIGSQEIQKDAEIKPISSAALSEMFPNLSSTEEEELGLRLKKYQKPSHSGGIGTFDELPEMAELLNSEFRLSGGGNSKFEAILKQAASSQNLNPNILKGIIFIESHGDNKAVSRMGAVGISQFMPDAAKRYGLIGKNGQDYRESPYASVIAMSEYLKDLRDLFGGNMGLASWAYHAGEGNVMGALRAYFKTALNPPTDIGDYDDAVLRKDEDKQKAIIFSTKNLVKATGVNVFHLLKNPSVASFIKEEGLRDDTENYVIKALSAAQYFEKSPMGLPISAQAS